MSDTLTTSSTELVPVISLETSDENGSSNTTTIASAALAAGVVLGVFGVPPLRRMLAKLFTRSQPEEKALEEVVNETTPTKVEKTV